MAGPNPIRSAVRQGCLLRTVSPPLLYILENKLQGLTIGQRRRRNTVIAYADDVTVFVTQPTDFDTIFRVIQLYEKATGARLNTRNLKHSPSGNGRRLQLS